MVTTTACLCISRSLEVTARHGANSDFQSNNFLEEPLPTKLCLGSRNKNQLAPENGTAEILCLETAAELQPDVNISFDVEESL